MSNYWNLCTIRLPEKNGLYEVRVSDKYDYLSYDQKTTMIFEDGDWIYNETIDYEDYIVLAWRYVEHDR